MLHWRRIVVGHVLWPDHVVALAAHQLRPDLGEGSELVAFDAGAVAGVGNVDVCLSCDNRLLDLVSVFGFSAFRQAVFAVVLVLVYEENVALFALRAAPMAVL